MNLFADRHLILIAPGFDEALTVLCLAALRRERLPALLVGLQPGPVRGAHGLIVHTDNTMNLLSPTLTPQLIFIPGAADCARTLLADRRVRQWLSLTIQAGGFVATATAAAPYMPACAWTRTAHFVPQGRLDDLAFIDLILHVTDGLYVPA